MATPNKYKSTNNFYGKVDVNISGGDINSQNGYSVQGTVGENAESTVWDTDSPLSITGGTFLAPNYGSFPVSISNQAGGQGSPIKNNPAPTADFINLSEDESVTFDPVDTPVTNPGADYFGEVEGAVLSDSPDKSQSVSYYSTYNSAVNNMGDDYAYSVKNGIVQTFEQGDGIVTIDASSQNTLVFYNETGETQNQNFSLDVLTNSNIPTPSLKVALSNIANTGTSLVSQTDLSSYGITVNQSGTIQYNGSGLNSGIYSLTFSPQDGQALSGLNPSSTIRFVVSTPTTK